MHSTAVYRKRIQLYELHNSGNAYDAISYRQLSVTRAHLLGSQKGAANTCGGGVTG